MALQDTLEQLNNVDFHNLDVNNIGAWPGVVKAMLMVVLFVLLLLVGYYWHLNDKRSALARVAAEELELRREYADKAGPAANLEALRQQKIAIEATFDSLLRQLPTDTEVPGLLEDITRTALDNDLTIESIDLQPEKPAEFYIELPIQVVVAGTYHKIGAFVSGVVNLPRIVTLHDFDIQPTASVPILRMAILAKTYRYVEEVKQ